MKGARKPAIERVRDKVFEDVQDWFKVLHAQCAMLLNEAGRVGLNQRKASHLSLLLLYQSVVFGLAARCRTPEWDLRVMGALSLGNIQEAIDYSATDIFPIQSSIQGFFKELTQAYAGSEPSLSLCRPRESLAARLLLRQQGKLPASPVKLSVSCKRPTPPRLFGKPRAGHQPPDGFQSPSKRNLQRVGQFHLPRALAAPANDSGGYRTP